MDCDYVANLEIVNETSLQHTQILMHIETITFNEFGRCCMQIGNAYLYQAPGLNSDCTLAFA